MHLIVVIVRLEILLLVIKSLHILRVLSVFIWWCNHVFFNLRRKSLNLFYIYVVIRVIIVVPKVIPFVKHVVLILLRILISHYLLVRYLTRQHLLVHTHKFLIIGLNHKSFSWCCRLESRTRGV